MTQKESWFAAFDSLAAKGVKVGDITREQICKELGVVLIVPTIFYQYRYLYRKEKGMK